MKQYFTKSGRRADRSGNISIQLTHLSLPRQSHIILTENPKQPFRLPGEQ